MNIRKEIDSCAPFDRCWNIGPRLFFMVFNVGMGGAGRAENPQKLGLRVLSASYLGFAGLMSLPGGIHFEHFPGRKMSKCFKYLLEILKFSKSLDSF